MLHIPCILFIGIILSISSTYATVISDNSILHEILEDTNISDKKEQLFMMDCNQYTYTVKEIEKNKSIFNHRIYSIESDDASPPLPNLHTFIRNLELPHWKEDTIHAYHLTVTRCAENILYNVAEIIATPGEKNCPSRRPGILEVITHEFIHGNLNNAVLYHVDLLSENIYHIQNCSGEQVPAKIRNLIISHRNDSFYLSETSFSTYQGIPYFLIFNYTRKEANIVIALKHKNALIPLY